MYLPVSTGAKSIKKSTKKSQSYNQNKVARFYGSRCRPIVTMAVSVAVCDIFSVKECPTLKTGLGFVQGHWKWHHW